MGKATPQRDHLSEVGFYTIGGRGLSITRNEKVSLKIRYKV